MSDNPKFNCYNLLELLQKHECNVKKLLDSFEILTDSMRGNIIEKLWIILFLLNAWPEYRLDEYELLPINITRNSIGTLIYSIEDFLKNENVYSRNDGGPTDILLQHRKTKNMVCMTCKNLNNETSVKDFEIEHIIANMVWPSPYWYLFDGKETKIVICVKNKIKTKKLFKQSHHDAHKARLKNKSMIMFDDKYLSTLLSNLKGSNLMNFSQPLKQHLTLQFHQKFTVAKIMNIILQRENTQSKFLIGWKPRSGKSYIIGALCIELYKQTCRNNRQFNVLILTPAPTETRTQIVDDMLERFSDFGFSTIHNIKSGNDMRRLNLKSTQNNIFIASKQLFDKYVEKDKCNKITELNLNVIFFDENHHGGTTDNSNEIIKTYSSPLGTTNLIFLTATFSKVLEKWNIQEECQFYWDDEDESFCKTHNINGLVAKHGTMIMDYYNNDYISEEFKCYEHMPMRMHLTSTFRSEFKGPIQDLNNSEGICGYSMRELVSTNYNGSQCTNVHEVDEFIKYVLGGETIYEPVSLLRNKHCIVERIKCISVKKDSRTLFTNNNFTTMLWFLPCGTNGGSSIEFVSNCLKARIELNRSGQEYDVLIVNGSENISDVKASIHEAEINAKFAKNKRGLIILAGKQLALGITLPNVDVVLMMHDDGYGDQYIQQIYRCGSSADGPTDLNCGKYKYYGFIVDFNTSRYLNFILKTKVRNKTFKTELDKIKYIIEHHLMLFDCDMMSSEKNISESIRIFTKLWIDTNKTHVQSFSKIENALCKLDLFISSKLSDKFNILFSNLILNKKNKKQNISMQVDENNYTELSSGYIISEKTIDLDCDNESDGTIDICSDNESDNDDNFEYVNDTCGNDCGSIADDDINDDNIQTTNLNFSKNILPYIISLVVILTKPTINNFMDMLLDIKNDDKLLSSFNAQLEYKSSFHKNYIIDAVIEFIADYKEELFLVFNIAFCLKMEITKLLDHPQKLLEYIEKNLPIKKHEKVTFGEVFTPMKIVFELLDKLDENYIKDHDKSIFEEIEFKWFDPTVGMGNFMVGVYLRLMDGLKDQIPNNDERQKHIIKNMLFMSEINSKNVQICNLIFNKYDVNIYAGDVFALNTNDEWGIEHFDVIVGNPPYNLKGIKTAWPRFVDFAFLKLKPDGYLVHIIPNGWIDPNFNSNSKSNFNTNYIATKYVAWIKLISKDKAQQLIGGKIATTLIVIKNCENITKKHTQITELITSESTCSLYLTPNVFISGILYEIFNKSSLFVEKHDVKLIFYDGDVTNTKSYITGPAFVLPNNHTVDNKYVVTTFVEKAQKNKIKGINCKKCNNIYSHTLDNKLIFANKMKLLYSFIDYGKLSVSNEDNHYVLGENLNIIKAICEFTLFELLVLNTKVREDFHNMKIVPNYIPDLRKFGIKYITEQQFYKLIGLTYDEVLKIKQISDNIKTIKNKIDAKMLETYNDPDAYYDKILKKIEAYDGCNLVDIDSDSDDEIDIKVEKCDDDDGCKSVVLDPNSDDDNCDSIPFEPNSDDDDDEIEVEPA